MNSHPKRFQILIPMFLLAGCGTFDDPKDYQPAISSPDTGQVCLYRTEPRSIPGVWQRWVMDGSWTGEIRPDRYRCLDTYAGRHIVRVESGNEKVEFVLEKDQRLFIKFKTDASPFGNGIYPVTVDLQTALQDLQTTEYALDHPDTTP